MIRLNPIAANMECNSTSEAREARGGPNVITAHTPAFEHPRRQYRAGSVWYLEHGNVFSSTMLTIRDGYLGTELRMPSIMDDGAFANMGRMNRDSHSPERIFSSRGRTRR